MDPTREDHDHDAHNEAETASNSSESESERNDESDTTGGENARDASSPQVVEKDDAEEDDEDVDSDAETQRIGDSVLRFARRCVKTGEFAKAVTALMNVVEISNLEAVPCRQSLLFAAQVFLATNQETKALACMMEIWDSTPPPYTTQHAQLLLAIIHERLERPRFAIYWFKRAFGGSFPPPLSVALGTWLALAERSYSQGDFVIATESYSQAFACVCQTQAWPSSVSVFGFVGRFLTAITSVAHMRPDRQSYRQQVAFSLAIAMVNSDALDTPLLQDRAFDLDYLLLRRVYAASFPSIYMYLFREEDRFVGRIARAWRVWQAREARKRAIAERERERRQAAEAEAATVTSKVAHARTKKKKATAKKPLPGEETDLEGPQLHLFRRRTKARIQSLRSTISPSPDKQMPLRLLSKPRPTERGPKADDTTASPTRRKLETVKRLRDTIYAKPAGLDDELTEEEAVGANQRPASSEASFPTSLLDVYSFPPLATHRRAFEVDAERAHGAADLDDDELNEIEAFARMAHYRSRVLRQQHTPVQEICHVAPQWLERFTDLVQFIQTHHQATAKSFFSKIHARVVMQLTDIHAKYRLQHGKTAFTIQLTKILRRLETWDFSSTDQELLPRLQRVKAIGEREEAQRNLEFYHASQHR